MFEFIARDGFRIRGHRREFKNRNEFRQKTLAISSFRSVRIAPTSDEFRDIHHVFSWYFEQKKEVFGEENPCHYSKNIATNRTKKGRKKAE